LKKQARSVQLCVLALVIVVAAVFTQAGTKANKNRIVLLISLDGFPAYALDDPRLPIPTLRKLAREGAVAASMRPVNPTVTWPNHTSMVTGVDASEHHVLFGGLLTYPGQGAPPTVEPWRDKELMVHAPTVYDLAYQAGLTTAQVDWVAIYGAKTITWQFPELPAPNGPIEREMIADGTVTAEQLRTFEQGSPAWQDQMWTAAAEDILERHPPNLLLFHLLALDNTNHEYGPMTMASFTTMAFLDSQVKQIRDVLQHAGQLSRATFILVSDHGHRPLKHYIHANIRLQEKGLVSDATAQQKADAWVIADGGIAMVYALNPHHGAELVSTLRSIFTGAEGVDRVYGVEDFPKLGLPIPAASDQAPDLVLAAAPDYAFTSEPSQNYLTQLTQGGTHGYLNTDPTMQAIFIASGAGIRKGIHLGAISNLDVAPTIAALLGLEMKQVKGRALQEILADNHEH
jgi:predicted AlkP superfamily pyrophosphatase or phosphodiesterase